MRFLFAVFLVWLAILLVPEKPAEAHSIIEERIFMSRTCTGSRWYLADSDDISITVHCDPDGEGDGN